MEAAAPHYYQERQLSHYEQLADTSARSYQLMKDFKVDELLEPLKVYFPNATKPHHAILSIAEEYGWSPQEVMSVIIDVANKFQPIFVTDQQFTSLDDQRGLQVGTFSHNFNGQAGTVRFGTETETTNIVDRLLPDEWNDYEHSFEDWLHRAEVAEDITLFFARGAAQLLNERSPANLFEAAQSLSPFLDYAEDCNKVSDLIKASELHLADQQVKSEDFSSVLKGSVGFAKLAPDEIAIDHDQWQRDKHAIDGQILQAWRDHSDFSTTPEEQKRLKAEYEEERRQLNALAQILKSELRYELNQRFRSATDRRF